MLSQQFAERRRCKGGCEKGDYAVLDNQALYPLLSIQNFKTQFDI